MSNQEEVPEPSIWEIIDIKPDAEDVEVINLDESYDDKPHSSINTDILQDAVNKGAIKQEDITPEMRVKADVFNRYVDELVENGVSKADALAAVSSAINEEYYNSAKGVKLAIAPAAIPLIIEGLGLVIAAALAQKVGEKLEETYTFLKEKNPQIVDSYKGSDKKSYAASPDPNDDWDPNDCEYEDAPYHHINSKGWKNSSPENGEELLKQSIRISDSSSRRVSVDSINNKFVIFDEETKNDNDKCKYHGHVRDWEELHQKHKNALIKAGKVNNKGKIL